MESARTRATMQKLLLRVWEHSHKTVLFVTHHPDDARSIAHDVAFVLNGRIDSAGPASRFFGADAPAAFRDYVGSARFAR